MNERPYISVVVPFYNEEGSLALLYEKIAKVLEQLHRPFEIIFIDDGSTDKSYEIVEPIAHNHTNVKIIRFETNSGKAKGLNEGFKTAKGEIVITMDADLQDDPEEIPNFIAKLEEDYDLVSGWKRKRHDPLEKRLPSKLFNTVTSWVTGLKLHDFNCGFKAYRREILDEIKVYGELHRYIPALAYWQGYRVGEIPVHHHPREFGISKYGWERYFRGFFDLFTIILLTKYIRNPMHLFGLPGFAFMVLGITILAFITFLQLKYDSIMGHKPLSYLGVLSILFGSQSISLGLLAEMLTNITQKRGRRQISIKNHFKHASKGTQQLDLSCVIPLHNEKPSLESLYKRLKSCLSSNALSYEILFVDDGSDDGSFNVLKKIYDSDSTIQVIQLRKKFGKASALQTGFDYSLGKTILTIDADLQDEPEQIDRFLSKIAAGYDLVLGRRVNIPFPRSIWSRAFNSATSFVGRVNIHDINCGLKAFKRPVIADLRLYGELHRLFPILAIKKGFSLTEVDVNHQERLYGTSNYGFSRIPKAFLDLLSVKLLTSYSRRPLHLFGFIGLAIGLSGFLINISLTLLKVITGSFGGHYTLLLIGLMLMVLGLQWFSTGILSELINQFVTDEQDSQYLQSPE